MKPPKRMNAILQDVATVCVGLQDFAVAGGKEPANNVITI